MQDEVGLDGGLNTYGYVGGNALHLVDKWGLSPQDVQKIIKKYSENIQSMNNLGIRNPNKTINNQQRFWGRLTNNIIGDSKKMDCGEQTDYMIDKLTKDSYDDQWTFYMNAGIGHTWGEAKSSNPKDPKIFFDPRSGEISLNKSCSTCKPWVGSPVLD